MDDTAAAGGPDGRHGPHVFVVDLDAPVLDPDDRHHLERAVRLRSGDPLTMADGSGRWRACRFGIDLEPIGDVRAEPSAGLPIVVAFAPVKGDRPELVVQKLTELGVDEIVPFWAERSVVRWDADRSRRQTDRLRRVAREAAMQCRRCRLPVIGDPVDFATVAGRPGAVLAERDGPPPVWSTDWSDDPAASGPVVLVGPEGGWSDAERASIEARMGVGGYVLRAETAAIAAATVLTALRSGVVRPV